MGTNKDKLKPRAEIDRAEKQASTLQPTITSLGA